MRTIKFRAKSFESEWVYGDLHLNCKFPHIHTQERRSIPIDTTTIGQFTGLYDKNGKEIYEGNIVRSTICTEFVYEVAYNDKRFASFGLHRKQDAFMHYFGEAIEAEECEVIGNVFDNSDLIEKGDNDGSKD